MILSKNCVNIACTDLKLIDALTLYLKYCCGFKRIEVNPISNPFRFLEALKMAQQCDFLVIDSFISGKPKGFQFAKNLKKRTLLIFYPDEIAIECVGKFWIEMPKEIGDLTEKINSILSTQPMNTKKYIDLEKNYPYLSDPKDHHS